MLLAEAKSIQLVSKIASLEVIFRIEFSGAIADFNPWSSNSTTQNISNQYSIDISFTFPGDILVIIADLF